MLEGDALRPRSADRRRRLPAAVWLSRRFDLALRRHCRHGSPVASAAASPAAGSRLPLPSHATALSARLSSPVSVAIAATGSPVASAAASTAPSATSSFRCSSLTACTPFKTITKTTKRYHARHGILRPRADTPKRKAGRITLAMQ
jgi:hypothetical protein